MKISTHLHGSNTEWSLGACDSTEIAYENLQKYVQRCCLEPGQHTLTCINNRTPYGWGDGYIEIQGHRYCDDFMSYRLIQTVTIRST